MLSTARRLGWSRGLSRHFSVVYGQRSFQVESPYSGEIVADIPLANELEAARTVAAASTAQKEWRTTSLDARIAVVQAFMENVEKNKDSIAKVASFVCRRRLRSCVYRARTGDGFLASFRSTLG